MKGLAALLDSKTAWLGTLATAADAWSNGGTLDWRILAASVLAFGLRSMGEHLGRALQSTSPRNPPPPAIQ